LEVGAAGVLVSTMPLDLDITDALSVPENSVLTSKTSPLFLSSTLNGIVEMLLALVVEDSLTPKTAPAPLVSLKAADLVAALDVAF